MKSPKLLHLNADTTWLLSLPTPTDEYFNVLIDPWYSIQVAGCPTLTSARLSGPQTDYTKLLSTQWHAIPSSVQHVSEIKERIDAVAICHEFTDHMHQTTLLECDKSIPVYAAMRRQSNHGTISWQFTKVPAFKCSQSWTTYSTNGLPVSIGISRIASPGRELVGYYHSALCFTYSTGPSDDASAIIYSPHGIPSSALEALPSANITSTTALLHGLHEITNPTILGGKLNLGAHNGLAAMQSSAARWWIGTHDEVKKGSGVVAMVLKRREWTVQEALEKAKHDGADVKYVALGSGESIVLD